MADPIRISALGRDGKVGDFYNYFTDAIVPSSIYVPKERKLISRTEEKIPTFEFFYQQPEKFKSLLLGINSHLLQNINKWSASNQQLWFSDYLNTNSMDGDERHAQVTLLFRVVRRTEALDPDFLRSKIDDYQLKSVEVGASYVIDQVVYGAEVICSMRKALDSSQETKEVTEVNMYLAAKTYLDETIRKSSTAELPVELDQVNCTVLSSLEPGKKNNGNFDSLNRYLQRLLNTEENQQKWKPIDFRLRNVPAIKIEAGLWSDRKTKIDLEKERHQVTKKWVMKYIDEISKNQLLKRFPLLEKHVCYFQHLVTHFWKKVEETYKSCETLPPEKAWEKMLFISDCLNKIIDWFAYRRKNIQEIGWLLSGTDFALLNSEEIQDRMTSKDYKKAKLFILKVEYTQDLLIHELEEYVGEQTSSAKLPVLPIFSYEEGRFQCVRTTLSKFANAKLATCGSEHGTNYYIRLDPSTLNDSVVVTVDYSCEQPQIISEENAVEHFDKQQQEYLLNSSDLSACFPATLTPTVVSNQNQQLKTDKGSEPTNTNFKENSTAKLPNNEENVRDNEEDYSDVEMDDAGCSQHPTGSTNTNSSMQQVYSAATTIHQKGSIGFESEEERLNLTMKQPHLSDAKEQSTSVAVQPKKNLNDGESKEQNSRVSKSKSCTDERYTKTHPWSSSVEGCVIQHQERGEKIIDGIRKGKVHEDVGINPYEDQNFRRTDQENRKLRDNRRIAEIYADESRSYSKLIRNGSPNVYLLNATEKSNSEKINWFDICWPGDSMRSRNPKNHKIIILMGATGSGKSTLINGMINYILGVQWNDPFRFKCVREDENAAKNQAHSQTSSVTAYTLHHQEGMTIPYSITIIDTPGYGDTRGVQRDKEITAAIHRFLTQQEIPIDEIHAACFVAASGDSRLTATQRYIIDSVLSIFGKDMKANLRLLVTFADNADPPVVGACLSANFPTTSASDGIAYSKFNSSVLYCSNAKQGDDEFRIDQLFWDMGHENFKKFFAMLERMKGRDLKSTREVIQSRRQVEQALVNIEQELEVCLVTIENMEIFQEKMKICGYNMEATKNYMVEHTVMRRQTSKCKKGFMAYNCRKCNVTCENNIKEKDPLHRSKRWCTKVSCECLDSDHQLDKWEWQLIPEKVTIPLLEMKAQYESNFDCKMNVEQLLNACGDNLLVAKTKVLSLLEQVAKNAQLLESTALRSNVLSPSDYLTLMRSRVLEEQAPGYSTRLHTLDELQQHLTYGTPLTAPKIVIYSPQPTYDSYNTGGGLGGYQDGSQSSRSKNQTSQQMSSHYYGTTTATGQVSKKAEGEKTGKQSYFSSMPFFGGKKK